VVHAKWVVCILEGHQKSLTLLSEKDFYAWIKFLHVFFNVNLLIKLRASWVPMVHRAFTAAYVGARWGLWPGPPANPPVGDWQLIFGLIKLDLIWFI
jgi:hypothetical protein